MPESASLAQQFGLLLGLREPYAVSATRSFRPWLGEAEDGDWPPRTDGGLWLVDTADRVARRDCRLWSARRPRPFAAALVVAGSGPPAGTVRRLLRRLRRRGARRWSEEKVAALLSGGERAPTVRRLVFEDDCSVPDSFQLDLGAASTGAAFLISDSPLFSGALWERVRDRLGWRDVQVRSIAVRMRGAAVAILGSADESAVLRVAPAGRLQQVVERNHERLGRLHEALGDDALTASIPSPLFRDTLGGVLLLVESHIGGTLAWKVAHGPLGDVIHRNALSFLENLAAATRTSVSFDTATEWMGAERALLHESGFVSDGIRRMLLAELGRLSALGEPGELRAHASHGDFGFGNLLVDPQSGSLTGVIDWDTSRAADFPAIDRVNLEVQRQRERQRSWSLREATEAVWQRRLAHDALQGWGGDIAPRILFGLAISRLVMRSFTYPEVYHRDEASFEATLSWLQGVGHT